MAKKNTKEQRPFELNMLDDCLERFKVIGKRQPLPTQHFYVEAAQIIRESIVASYEAGVADGKSDTETFPVKDYKVS